LKHQIFVLADLDHANPKLRGALKDWLRFLKEEIGFEGWRFDFVKGYAAEFVTEYVNDTLGKGTFNVAEYWVDVKCEPLPDCIR
jgi:alpha-amylase